MRKRFKDRNQPALRGHMVGWRTNASALLLVVVAGLKPVYAQPTASSPAVGQVRINLRGATPLSTLVEYVSNRANIRFIYDESLSQKQINLQIPEEIPVESLFEVLQSALLVNGMAVSSTESPGWYRIVPNDRIPQVSVPSRSDEELQAMGSAMPVTQVFTLQRGDPNQIKTLIQPFLTSLGSNVIAVPANRTIIATDIAANLRRISKLIELLDAEQYTSSIRIVKAEQVNVQLLAEKLRLILEARARMESTGPTSGVQQTASQTNIGVEIAVDERLNQLILIGLPAQIEAAIEILKILDVPLATSTITYRPQFLSAEQLNSIILTWVDSISPRPVFDARVEGSALVITTMETVHSEIRRLILQLDSRETSAKQSPIRFYKIKNVPVQDILDTLNSLQGGFGNNPFASQGRDNSRSRTTNDRAIPGQNNPFLVNGGTAQPGLIPPNPPALRNGLSQVNGQTAQLQSQAGGSPLLDSQNVTYGAGFPFNNGSLGVGNNLGYFGGGLPYERGIQSPLGNATVTGDIGSNTLIIIAEPEVQQAYEQLIEFLDKRRPQVMIEARVVIIDTSDNFTLGVEVSGGDRQGDKRLFAFSSYGLSQVNPINGALTINPGTGFNATLVDPSTADVVVRALTNHRRARVLSSPKILVDDNAEGTLTSVNEVPFTSVNASQTVATTSFAGFAEAGTTITVTPTISEARHINLNYIVTLNSFTGAGSAGVPPPRQTNEISSRVTVPDTYTIIVGGLTQKNDSSTFSGIPYLEKIPLLRDISSLQGNSFSETSLFVFLRPVIVDDDKFRDLLYLTKGAAKKAKDGHNYPASSPLIMLSEDCD